MASTLGSDHGPVKREPGAFRAAKKSRVQCNGGWVWVKEGKMTERRREQHTASKQRSRKGHRKQMSVVCLKFRVGQSLWLCPL